MFQYGEGYRTEPEGLSGAHANRYRAMMLERELRRTFWLTLEEQKPDRIVQTLPGCVYCLSCE